MSVTSETIGLQEMENALSDNLFQKFSELVYQKCGINLHEGKKALLQARLNKRLRASGLSSYRDYYQYLTTRGDDQELREFLDCISTNLTYFFRESQHFGFLDEVFLPELIEKKRREHSNRIRIWSAGCSTGEEPYSLAMCVASHLKEVGQWDFRILATDISTRVLDVATRGVYGPDKVEKVPPALRQRYFRRCDRNGANGDYEVSPLLKSIVTFRRLNLKEPFPFKGPFDCVFCRNVMIYFDKPTQENLIRKMAGYLDHGGHLFVGHSESLMGLDHPLTYVRPAIYRK